MKISLIIPAYNEEKNIRVCLQKALERAPKNLREILVIDNASTDRTAEVASSFAKTRVVSEPKKGITRARQKGLVEAKGELLAYVDADTKIPKNWFNLINQEFSKDSSLVCLTGPYYYYDLPAWQRKIIELTYLFFICPAHRFMSSVVTGGNFVAKKEALEKIGGFDETIPFYGEDTDLAVRLKKVGRIVFSRNFYINTSGRRYIEEGFFRIGVIYVINYIWETIFRKPFTTNYKDVRL